MLLMCKHRFCNALWLTIFVLLHCMVSSDMETNLRMVRLIMELVGNRSYTLTTANGKRSRLQRLKNGITQESVLAPLLFNIYCTHMGVGRGAGEPWPPWILKSLAKKVVFSSSSRKNQISPLLAPLGKNFGKIPYWPPPGKKSFRRPCVHLWLANYHLQKLCIHQRPSDHACWRLRNSGRGAKQRHGNRRWIPAAGS